MQTLDVAVLISHFLLQRYSHSSQNSSIFRSCHPIRKWYKQYLFPKKIGYEKEYAKLMLFFTFESPISATRMIAGQIISSGSVVQFRSKLSDFTYDHLLLRIYFRHLLIFRLVYRKTIYCERVSKTFARENHGKTQPRSIPLLLDLHH